MLTENQEGGTVSGNEAKLVDINLSFFLLQILVGRIQRQEGQCNNDVTNQAALLIAVR